MPATSNPDIRFIDIRHTRVAHRTVGSGPDLVFVHGWPLQSATWRNVVAALPGYTCHLIDLPGAGASRATPTTPLSFVGQIGSLDAVLEQLDLPVFTLIGHNSGGLIARHVADRRPAQVAALVLSGTEIPDRHSLLFRSLAASGRLPGIGSILAASLSRPRLRRLPFVLGGCFADASLLDGEFAEQLIDPLLRDGDQFSAQVHILKSFSFDAIDALADVHARLTAPTLLIWGRNDPFFPVEQAREMSAEFAGPTRFEVIDDAKLLVHEEHPEQFAGLAKSFLAQFVPRLSSPCRNGATGRGLMVSEARSNDGSVVFLCGSTSRGRTFRLPPDAGSP